MDITHAIYAVDNWDGEGDRYWIFAYKVKGEWVSYESGKPLLKYEGDKILRVVPLSI